MEQEISKIIDLNRKRAEFSYINLMDFLKDSVTDDENKKKMKSYCRKLPVLIKTNGLLKTLSFIKAKSKQGDNERNEYTYIYSWLIRWFNTLENNEEINIFTELINMDTKKYYIYTKEAIEISIWYKRHVESML